MDEIGALDPDAYLPDEDSDGKPTVEDAKERRELFRKSRGGRVARLRDPRVSPEAKKRLYESLRDAPLTRKEELLVTNPHIPSDRDVLEIIARGPQTEADKKFIRKWDWKLDGTPVAEVLTPEGLDQLPAKWRTVLMRELPFQWRKAVGLVRQLPAFDGETTHPEGYVPISIAYKHVSTLTPEDVVRLSKGQRPKDVRWKKKKITSQFQRAAREFLSAGPRGLPQEINTRTDGPIVQRVEQVSVNYVVEAPPVITIDQWQEQARRALASGSAKPEP